MANLQRIRVSSFAAVLLLSGLASGQQERAKGGGRIVLKERRVEVVISDNVAIIRHVFKVANPGDRMAEGRVTLDLPEGAVACDLSLLRNVASTDRRAKIMSPARASALYEVAKRRDLSLEEVLAPDALLAGPAGILPGPKAAQGDKDDDKDADDFLEPGRDEQKRKDKDVKAPPPPPRSGRRS